jgi:hypothetical protein
MGIHAGLVSRAATGYSGLEVHRVARVTAAGHGGQILVSAAARALLAARSELVDLGEHRLKDFAEPERLWLLVHDDRGPGDFPALRTEPVRPTNLPADPAPGTRLIGRERERREPIDLICADDARLVSLVGPGGVGKTRLALELAAAAMPRFRDGAAWVELDAVGRAEHVPGTVARALSVIPLPGETPEEALLRVLEAKQLLLVIDNFEHVLEAAPPVAALVAHCATLTVLATSREALDLAAERVYPVAPLALPAGGEGLTAAGVEASPAGALFVAAAKRHDPSFRVGDTTARAIAEICTRLDGLPLAIELAAARVRLLSPESLAARLDRALATLASGPRDAPERQRTLRATIDWSYRLLDAREQAAFARFASSPAARPLRLPRRSPRQTSARSTAWSPRACSRDASTRSRPPGWGCSRRSAPTPAGASPPRPMSRPCARTTIATTSRSPAATEPIARFGVPAPGSTSPGWTPRSTTSTRLSDGRSRSRAPSRRSRWRRRSAATGSCETATPTPWTGSSRP